MMKTSLYLKNIFSTTLALAVIALTPVPSLLHAAAPQCQSIFKQEETLGKSSETELQSEKKASNQALREQLNENYQNRNATLSKRYPTLEFVFKDPEAFVKSMKQRFEEQKKITPEDPRLFNFPEASSTMKEIRVDLEKFRQEIIIELQSEKKSIQNRASHLVLSQRSSKVETMTKSLQYIKKIQADIDAMITSNNYPYRDTVYTLYYYSRIRGIFQFKELTTYYQILKYLDMSMHGYRRLNIDGELKLYKEKGSPIVQVRSGKVASEFRTAELPFRDAFERKDTLEYVIIPSVYALGSSAFLHVLPHKIHFIGATNTPVQADGFNRPGGLFWMHDVRHEADRYMKINAYRKSQNLTEQQDKTLTLYMHKWHAEFLNLKNSVQDPAVKAAMEHYHFYTHHDVGVPLIPSMFLNHHKDGMLVYYAFLFHKNNAGQTPEFKNWVENTRKAQEILTQFWSERLPLEKQLLQKEPLEIKNWEEWFPLSHSNTQSKVSVYNHAIESKSLVRVKTEVAGVDGTLSKVLFDQKGEPIFMQFGGKAQLIENNNQVIAGQGPSVHGQGYSTPVGPIKQVIIDGNKSDLSQLKAQQLVEIQYESGIIVRGELKNFTLNEKSELTVLTFNTAEIKVVEKTLYKPEWGSFDLLMGSSIKSFEVLL